ncbi:MAG: DUF1554 domain-containing protein [Thermoanaerobaculia bacterium]|nr:DUF1554 domain-containing protein [Thermoanaerobaculia bacterium]
MPSPPRFSRCFLLALIAWPASAHASVQRIFLTSASGNGDLASWAATDLDGVAGANEVCQTLAENAGLSPGSETFRAWLSDLGTDAYCNVQGLTGKRSDIPACAGGAEIGGGPWVRTDGKLFAASLAQISSGSATPYVPASILETGAEVASVLTRIWTGSSSSGALTASSCTGFQVATGAGAAGRVETLAFGTGPTTACGGSQKLLCFETGVGDPVPLPSDPGYLAFVSASVGSGELGSWALANGETGIAAGDEVCRKEAENGRLPAPESFRAWLSTSTTDAFCRIQGLTGTRADGCGGATLPPPAPYRRPDGIEIAADLDDLSDGRLATPILRLSGSVSFGGTWTGSGTDGTLDGQSCGDWLDPTTGVSAQTGAAQFLSPSWSVNGQNSCDLNFLGLYCFSTVVTLFWDDFEGQSLTRWSDLQP